MRRSNSAALSPCSLATGTGRLFLFARLEEVPACLPALSLTPLGTFPARSRLFVL